RSVSLATSTGEGALSPPGPRLPTVGVEQARSESGRTGNEIKAREVELILPGASALELDVTTAHGVVALAVPDEVNASFHERSSSSVRMTVGNAEGDLRVRAESRAKVTLLRP